MQLLEDIFGGLIDFDKLVEEGLYEVELWEDVDAGGDWGRVLALDEVVDVGEDQEAVVHGWYFYRKWYFRIVEGILYMWENK